MNTAFRSRLVVLGLDGLPFSTAVRLCREGRLPNLARLALSPRACPIQAELPELSPVNWTSFFTAAGPEEHGIFGFTSLDPHSYALRFADATQIRVRTIFDRLGERGLSSRIVNLPNMYPAKPLKGMLVAGFTAPELSRAVYPPFLAHQLRDRGYLLEADTDRGGHDPRYLLESLESTLRGRRAALDLLWPDQAWDLFVLVLTETDRLGHFLFPALEDEHHPWREPCLDFLTKWDALIGEVLERFADLPEPKRLMVLADHGFAGLIAETDLNAWLKQQGLLALGRAPDNEWDCRHITRQTLAFALDPGRIYLHTPRFVRGRLSESRAEALRETLRQALLSLTWQETPVMQAVFHGRKLYPGADSPLVPDLVCLPRPGFSLRAKFNATKVFDKAHRQGCHTAHNAFFFDSAGSIPQRVRDVGREVLHFFQADAPLILVRNHFETQT
ncbi:MAG TPA: phosphodiesterase [Desulfonatronum sp.]|nr:phosphodiesterase [Desulfonatronum sp.]